MHQEMYDDEKRKAMEALLEKMYEMIADGSGDKPVPDREISAEEVIEDKKPLAFKEGEEDGEKEEASEEEPTLSEMLKDFMEGPKKMPSGKSQTVMISGSLEKKPVKKKMKI